MKVFLAGTSLRSAYGGPAYSVARLAVALAEEGVTVGLWAPDQSAVDTPMLPAGSTVQRLEGSAEQAIASFGRSDVIHDNGLWLPHNHALARIAHRGGIPRVVSTRGMLEPWAMRHKGLKKRVAWMLYQKRDLCIASIHHATSAAEAANLERMRLGVPVCVIPNGVDIPPSADLDELAASRDGSTGHRTAVFLGRIYPIKGLPMLVAAWRRVRPSGWKLVIAGPDEAGHLDELKRSVNAAGLDDVVAFVGPVMGDEKLRLLGQADLFVLPSHSESFGMAIAEAMAHRLPVLTTTAAPWPVLDEKNCGWRVDPDTDSIANGLRRATSIEPQALAEMGTRGQAVVAELYQWEKIASTFVSAYETSCAARPAMLMTTRWRRAPS